MNDRLNKLRELLVAELQSESPTLIYIDDLKLSINRLEKSEARNKTKPDYEMVQS